MSEADTLEKPQAGTSIAVIVESNPSIVLLDAKSKDDLFNHIRSEINAFEPDLSTVKGRDAIKKLAYKITRTKTAIDAAGKALNEDARAQISVVDAARRDARNTLDIMAEQVRKPLTDWEEAEAGRIAECREVIKWLKSSLNVYMDDTADDVRARGKAVYETVLDADKYGDMLAEAEEAKDATVASLRASLARLTKEEADRAELARLQQAEQERLANEAAEREAEEQRQREAEQARISEERRVAAEQAEQERIERAKQEAAESAKREEQDANERAFAAEQKRIDDERAEQQRKHDEELAAERDRIAALERENAKREQAEQRLREETERRQKDVEHRNSVKNAARDALMTTGASNALATKIVLAILAGDIPAVRLEF